MCPACSAGPAAKCCTLWVCVRFQNFLPPLRWPSCRRPRLRPCCSSRWSRSRRYSRWAGRQPLRLSSSFSAPLLVAALWCGGALPPPASHIGLAEGDLGAPARGLPAGLTERLVWPAEEGTLQHFTPTPPAHSHPNPQTQVNPRQYRAIVRRREQRQRQAAQARAAAAKAVSGRGGGALGALARSVASAGQLLLAGCLGGREQAPNPRRGRGAVRSSVACQLTGAPSNSPSAGSGLQGQVLTNDFGPCCAPVRAVLCCAALPEPGPARDCGDQAAQPRQVCQAAGG